MACQIIPIVRVGDFRFLGTIINELPARDTQGRATASGGTAPVSAPSHCIECNEWVDSACAYTGCPLRSPKACAGGVSESFGRNATGGFSESDFNTAQGVSDGHHRSFTPAASVPFHFTGNTHVDQQ